MSAGGPLDRSPDLAYHTAMAPHPRRVALFGGTFDPIHVGHLRLAEEMADALQLERVVFVPSGQPPHRGRPRVAAHDRLEMVRRAVAGNPRFAVDGRETERDAPSYSVETLAALRAEWGTERPIWMLLGADAFLGLPQWHAWQRLLDLVHIAVATRPTSPLLAPGELPAALREEIDTHEAASPAGPAGTVRFEPMTALDVSATALRAALAAGHSVRYLVPDAVLNYIEAQQLYRPT